MCVVRRRSAHAHDGLVDYDRPRRSRQAVDLHRGALAAADASLTLQIKERRDWDISARERLDGIGQLARFGIEHFGADTQGIEVARRFLCEALSWQQRYIPVGLLERLPAQLNHRPMPYRGRNDLETLLASDNATDWVKICAWPSDDALADALQPRCSSARRRRTSASSPSTSAFT